MILPITIVIVSLILFLYSLYFIGKRSEKKRIDNQNYRRESFRQIYDPKQKINYFKDVLEDR